VFIVQLIKGSIGRYEGNPGFVGPSCDVPDSEPDYDGMG
jgi:hypothetical protein